MSLDQIGGKNIHYYITFLLKNIFVLYPFNMALYLETLFPKLYEQEEKSCVQSN